MNILVLGATGPTGRELVRQALARGHDVTAVARDPSKLDDRGVRRAAGDVRNPESMTRALAGAEIVVLGLGVAKGERPGVLTGGVARRGRVAALHRADRASPAGTLDYPRG